MFAIQEHHAVPSGCAGEAKRSEAKGSTMPEILFPEKWWQMPQEDYNSAKAALKGLISKDPDSGSAEVFIKKVFRTGEGKGDLRD